MSTTRARTRTPKPAAETRIQRYMRQRCDEAFSFQEMVGEGDLDLDALAKSLWERDRRAGANVRRIKETDDQVLRAALPEALQKRFRDYIDAIEGLTLYYAEVGYLLGLEAAAAMRNR